MCCTALGRWTLTTVSRRLRRATSSQMLEWRQSDCSISVQIPSVSPALAAASGSHESKQRQLNQSPAARRGGLDTGRADDGERCKVSHRIRVGALQRNRSAVRAGRLRQLHWHRHSTADRDLGTAAGRVDDFLLGLAGQRVFSPTNGIPAQAGRRTSRRTRTI